MANNNQIYKMSNAGGFKSLNRYYDMLAGNPAVVLNSYESISTVTVGAGGASAITFSSIPSTYKHLQIRGIILGATGANNVAFQMGNGSLDTGTNYAAHQMQSNGATTTGNSAVSQNFAYLEGLLISSTIYPFAAVYDILDYANTGKYKTIRGLSGQDGNGSGTATDWRVQLTSGLWQSTAAVNTIAISSPGNTLGQYSSFALYGIKG